MQVYGMRIDGRVVSSDVTREVRSPYDGSLVGQVALGNEGHLAGAVASASRAFGDFSRSPTHVRATLLERIAQGIGARSEEIAHLITRESGKPIRYSRAEVLRGQSTFTLAAAEARAFGGEVLPADQLPGQEGRWCLYKRVPRGPVAAISPFNFPLNLVAHKVAPALAVGATVVLKPAAQAPLTAHLLSEIVDQAGAPAGVF
ncbi:MAG TPA: aldehyde dehydrogenase family protein, partial [Polyangiaceae bacterium]|nr:aldehyde dehydrogenase family protein [Polyangiaceae bacterium]